MIVILFPAMSLQRSSAVEGCAAGEPCKWLFIQKCALVQFNYESNGKLFSVLSYPNTD